jgi:tRNA wybutosine-synthesizing protein 1
MTFIRNHNDAIEFREEFVKIMLEGNPHFIELKSYMHVGMSTQRLMKENMLEMNEIRDMAGGLCAKIPYFSVMDESEISRIVVLQNQNRFVDRWIDHPT